MRNRWYFKGKNIIFLQKYRWWKNYFSSVETVYISDCYGNKNSLEKLFLGIDNVWFISDRYLKSTKKGVKKVNGEQATKEWYNFFKTLGCSEFPYDQELECKMTWLDLIIMEIRKINQLLIIFDQHWIYYKKAFNRPTFINFLFGTKS